MVVPAVPRGNSLRISRLREEFPVQDSNQASARLPAPGRSHERSRQRAQAFQPGRIFPRSASRSSLTSSTSRMLELGAQAPRHWLDFVLHQHRWLLTAVYAYVILADGRRPIDDRHFLFPDHRHHAGQQQHSAGLLHFVGHRRPGAVPDGPAGIFPDEPTTKSKPKCPICSGRILIRYSSFATYFVLLPGSSRLVVLIT